MHNHKSAASAEPAQLRPRLASRQPGTMVECSVMEPCGDGVRDLEIVLREPTPSLSQWYDTYDGKHDREPDWYAIHLPRRQAINTIFFAHGPIFPVGGWWKSLQPQCLDTTGTWRDIPHARLTPDYSCADVRGNRRPFEPFQISFPAIETSGIRLLGQPGGPIGITTISHIAAGFFTPAEAESYLEQLRRPIPQIFQLLPPNKLWDLLLRLREVTQIAFDVQCSEGLGLDHFLDEQRFHQFHDQRASAYDPRSLYQLIGTHEGWNQFGVGAEAARQKAIETRLPVIQEHHGNMVWLVIPVLANGVVVGTIENRDLICRDYPDPEWHTAAPHRLGIDSDHYQVALIDVPVIPNRQLEAVVHLLQQIVLLSQEQIEQRIEVQELRHTVDELAVPILPVWHGVLTVPLAGQIDQHRAQQITTTVLQQITKHKAQTVIVDVTGVVMIDADVVANVVRLAQAMKLLGARCLMSGIRPEVAMTAVAMGVSMTFVQTFATLQSALAVAIGQDPRNKLR